MGLNNQPNLEMTIGERWWREIVCPVISRDFCSFLRLSRSANRRRHLSLLIHPFVWWVYSSAAGFSPAAIQWSVAATTKKTHPNICDLLYGHRLLLIPPAITCSWLFMSPPVPYSISQDSFNIHWKVFSYFWGDPINIGPVVSGRVIFFFSSFFLLLLNGRPAFSNNQHMQREMKSSREREL